MLGEVKSANGQMSLNIRLSQHVSAIKRYCSEAHFKTIMWSILSFSDLGII